MQCGKLSFNLVCGEQEDKQIRKLPWMSGCYELQVVHLRDCHQCWVTG